MDAYKTNNAREVWHNRFPAPGVEQAGTKASLAEFAVGRRVKANPKKKWLELQTRTQTIAMPSTTTKEICSLWITNK